MKNECWINVFKGTKKDKEKVLYSSRWAYRMEAVAHAYLGGRKLLYRIHIKDKSNG